MLTLFTDTDCDVTPRVAAKYGYKLISMPYSIDSKTTYPYEESEDFDFHAFYDSLRAGTLPTTSAISAERYREYFEPEFKAGNDILYVHFSAAMTMTFDVMKPEVEKLLQEYPGRKFYSIDTKGITTISYVIASEVGEMILKGKTPEEVVEWASTEVDHYAMYFFADDLKFFRRSGRVGGLAATMGGLIGLRPIIIMSQEGKMESIGTVKGRRGAVERLLTAVAVLGDDVAGHRIAIGHTDAPELVEQVRQALESRFGIKDIDIVDCNPTAGSHAGPDGVGIVFHAKKRQ